MGFVKQVVVGNGKVTVLVASAVRLFVCFDWVPDRRSDDWIVVVFRAFQWYIVAMFWNCSDQIFLGCSVVGWCSGCSRCFDVRVTGLQRVVDSCKFSIRNQIANIMIALLSFHVISINFVSQPFFKADWLNASAGKVVHKYIVVSQQEIKVSTQCWVFVTWVQSLLKLGHCMYVYWCFLFTCLSC